MAYTAEQFFGKIGVSKGIFTQKELDECFKIQRERFKQTGSREPLSYILQEKKLITREQMYKILQEFKYSCMRRDDKKIAEIIRQKGILKPQEVEIALKFQRKLFRSGVGLFQLGEILISKEILSERTVYEVLCDYWKLRNPNKELPNHVKPQRLVRMNENSEFKSTTRLQVDKIHDSEGKSGYKVCDICGHENSLDTTYCQGCSERLMKYTIKVKADINNVTLFKKEVNEELQSNELKSSVECKFCGFQNPDMAEICYNCLVPLYDKQSKTDTQPNELAEENSVELKEMPENLDSFPSSDATKSKYSQNESLRFLIEDKRAELSDDIVEKTYLKDEKTDSVDTLVFEPIIYDPTSSKLFLPFNIEVKAMKRCHHCGYMNSEILPFCFVCHEIFEDNKHKQ